MKEEIKLVKGGLAHKPVLQKLYKAAFPDEDLLPLINRLLPCEEDLVLSLVAMREEQVLGHVAFTFCTIKQATQPVALLGPIAVDPKSQKQGIGSMLILEGMAQLKAQGVEAIYVLGDPGYYGRFGFKAESHIMPPYPLPSEWATAWQSLGQSNVKPPGFSVGEDILVVPDIWEDPVLWGP